MKAVILCGGRGTRLGEHGVAVPKALIHIGEKPVIWHLMNIYARHGVTEFVLCLGHLGNWIRKWFDGNRTPWKIVMVDTGSDTETGGRLYSVRDQVADEIAFCVTYGDGLSDVNIKDLVDFHLAHGKTATVTSVHPISNFGLMDISDTGRVTGFREKPKLKEWVNGGFFVFGQAIFDYLDEDCTLERQPFESMSNAGQMMAFRHDGFWKCMDTYKDSLEFAELWQNGAPWIK